MAAALLGAEVIKNDGTKVQVSSFCSDGKIVGVYFSAHWCPPCRAFTPKLGQYYEEQKKGPNADKFEIVFVSCDRDDDSFKDYFKTMPFLAVDFGAEEAKERLNSHFSVSGIPSLIFIKSDGTVITKDGRSHVTNNNDIGELL